MNSDALARTLRGNAQRSMYTNGTLTAITAPGDSEDYDSPTGAGAVRWQGSQPVRVTDEVVQTLSPGRVDEVQQTRLDVPYEPGRLIRRGDTIGYSYDGETASRVAATISRTPLLDRVRVLLQDA